MNKLAQTNPYNQNNKSNGFAHILIVALVILLLIGGGAVYYFANITKNKRLLTEVSHNQVNELENFSQINDEITKLLDSYDQGSVQGLSTNTENKNVLGIKDNPIYQNAKNINEKINNQLEILNNIDDNTTKAQTYMRKLKIEENNLIENTNSFTSKARPSLKLNKAINSIILESVIFGDSIRVELQNVLLSGASTESIDKFEKMIDDNYKSLGNLFREIDISEIENEDLNQEDLDELANMIESQATLWDGFIEALRNKDMAKLDTETVKIINSGNHMLEGGSVLLSSENEDNEIINEVKNLLRDWKNFAETL